MRNVVTPANRVVETVDSSLNQKYFPKPSGMVPMPARIFEIRGFPISNAFPLKLAAGKVIFQFVPSRTGANLVACDSAACVMGMSQSMMSVVRIRSPIE